MSKVTVGLFRFSTKKHHNNDNKKKGAGIGILSV